MKEKFELDDNKLEKVDGGTYYGGICGPNNSGCGGGVYVDGNPDFPAQNPGATNYGGICGNPGGEINNCYNHGRPR